MEKKIIKRIVGDHSIQQNVDGKAKKYYPGDEIIFTSKEIESLFDKGNHLKPKKDK